MRQKGLLQRVRALANSIRKYEGDDESQHSTEDALHVEIIQAIHDGTCTLEEAQAAAAVALEIRRMDFSRWCA